MRFVAFGVVAILSLAIGAGIGFWAANRPRNTVLSITSYSCADKDLVVAVPSGFTGYVVAEAFEIGGPANPQIPGDHAVSAVGTGQTSVTLPMDIADEKNTRIRVWAVLQHAQGDYDCRP